MLVVLDNHTSRADWCCDTFDGNPRSDWHRAAQLGGNALLEIAPHRRVFVGGLEWSQHLEGVREKPIALSVPNRVVYATHEYSFFHADIGAHGHAGNPRAYAETLGDRWGFILTKGKPWTAPIWVSEIGTCDSHRATGTALTR